MPTMVPALVSGIWRAALTEFKTSWASAVPTRYWDTPGVPSPA